MAGTFNCSGGTDLRQAGGKEAAARSLARRAAKNKNARMTRDLSNLLVLIVAARTLGGLWRVERRSRLAALRVHHLLAATMARHSTLTAGFARLLAGPLVGRPLLVGRLATLAGNLALFHAIHRGESAILFSHTSLPDSLRSLSPRHIASGRPSVPEAADRLSGPPRGPTAPHNPASPNGPFVRWVVAATDVPRLKSGRSVTLSNRGT